jgi:hypothetical protein
MNEELKQQALAVAEAMKSSSNLSPALRQQFIDVRAALFVRGIYDPVLVRFDSATVAQAQVSEIAEQLATVAAAL